MGNVIRGQAPLPGTPGRFLNKQSVAGQKVVRVLSGISDAAVVSLGISPGGPPPGNNWDTGYINNRLRATIDGKLIDFIDLFGVSWTNCFINDPTTSDFTLEILRGTAFSDEEARITVGQYNPFTPDTGYSMVNVPNFHNFDTGASYAVWAQSVWKVFIIGDPQ